MAERLGEFVRAERLVIRGEDADTLAADHPQTFDLALLAFGVLAHVARRAERLRLLRAIRSMLKADGTLILSVPNARRRFRAEQRTSASLVDAGKLEPGDILYKRGEDNGEIQLFYHLYALAEVRDDLAEAGFRVTNVGAESLLSERTVVSDPLTGWLDAVACRIAPASLGYDLLAVAQAADLEVFPDRARAAHREERTACLLVIGNHDSSQAISFSLFESEENGIGNYAWSAPCHTLSVTVRAVTDRFPSASVTLWRYGKSDRPVAAAPGRGLWPGRGGYGSLPVRRARPFRRRRRLLPAPAVSLFQLSAPGPERRHGIAQKRRYVIAETGDTLALAWRRALFGWLASVTTLTCLGGFCAARPLPLGLALGGVRTARPLPLGLVLGGVRAA